LKIFLPFEMADDGGVFGRSVLTGFAGDTMGLDLAKAHGWILKQLGEYQSIAESMGQLIDQCAADCPHADWRPLRDLPYDDISSLLDWLRQLIEADSPASALRGLWFGIFNPHRDGHASADFYISGSERFDADPDSNAWAVRPAWRPNGREAFSEIMASIYAIAYGAGGLGNDAEYPLCLAYTALAVRELLNTLSPRTVLSAVGSVGVAVGFDSGDFILLGRTTADGLGPL
jgi:hypothetical protein